MSNMTTENATFLTIMGNGNKYKVPRFQRDYSWQRDQWEDLWEDIDNLDNEKEHYMGYIVLQTCSETEEGEKARELIIDGQQRLATLSIIILSALKRLKELAEHNDDDKKREETIRNAYIGTISPVSLTTENKLELNRNNKRIFERIAQINAPNPAKEEPSNKLLINAYDFFYDKIKNKSGVEIAKFTGRFSNSLFFTKITVADELNAYKVFETLNARGVKLTTPDLLKNYLFSIISDKKNATDSEMDELDTKWNEIIQKLAQQDFPKFLLAEWNSKNRLTSRNELFKKIKESIQTGEDAFCYLFRLEKSAELYAALFSPNDDFWNRDIYQKCQKKLEFFKIFSLTRAFTVFLAAYQKFSAQEFARLMDDILMLSVRYNAICKLETKPQESIYNAIARKIQSEQFTRSSHVRNSNEFKKIYPSDEDFTTAFKRLQVPTSQTTKKIKYLLSKLENSLSQKPISSSPISIEHILPKNPSEEWIERFGADWHNAINRLGNMILLTSNDNKNCDRKTFDQKKSIYKASEFKLAHKVSEYDNWDNQQLNDYQEWLGGKAVILWHINFSSNN